MHRRQQCRVPVSSLVCAGIRGKDEQEVWMWSWQSPFMSACDPLIQAERRFKARCLNRSRWDLFPCRGPVVPCRTLSLVSATYNGIVKPWFARPRFGTTSVPKVVQRVPIVRGRICFRRLLTQIQLTAVDARLCSSVFMMARRAFCRQSSDAAPSPAACRQDGFAFGYRALCWSSGTGAALYRCARKFRNEDRRA